MAKATLDWMKDLERWLRPFLGRLGHKARRRMCPAYVSGLIGPGDRKSVQPMAERLALGSYDRLHHFISSGVWDAAPIVAELIVQADKLVGGRDAVLVIDDTAMLKKGKHSVGVAPQYCSTLGKIANCQTLVSLTLARREVPIMLALRLFLPESWTSDPSRLKRAGVPTAYRKPRTKSEVALEELDRVIAAGVRFGCVLTDAGYGQSASFRQELTARELRWAVGIPRHLKVYPADVKMIRSMVRRGRLVGRRHTSCRGPPNTCWGRLDGARSAGGLAPKENSRRASPPCACASPTDRRSGSGTKASSIYLARKFGSSANTGIAAKRNTISPISRRRPICAHWQPPSRRAGSASRRINSSKRRS